MIFMAVVLLGLLVSLVSVFLGLGGGTLLVPLLPTFFGISIHQAVATSVLTIFLTVSSNTVFFHRQGLVNWSLVFLMGPPALVTAFIAGYFGQRMDECFILGLLMILLGAIGIKNILQRGEYKQVWPLSFRQKFGASLGGVLGGLGSGLAGIGSGSIFSSTVIVLKMVEPRQLSPTANGCMVLTSFGAVLSFLIGGMNGEGSWDQWIQWPLSVSIFLVSQGFAYFLRPKQNSLPFLLKSTILSILLLGISIKIGWMILSN